MITTNTAEPRPKLTERQSQYLDYIRSFLLNCHRLPTFQEISDGMELTRASAPWYVIQALIRKGYLTPGPCGRSYALPQNDATVVSHRLLPGQSFVIGNVYIGVFGVDRNTGAVDLEVIAPEFMGEPDPEKGVFCA